MAKRNISIYYDEHGIRQIMKGHEIYEVEQDIMMKKLSQVKADFIHQFGFDGQFELKAVNTSSRRSRLSFRIVPADKRTTMALKKQPGWLAKFL